MDGGGEKGSDEKIMDLAEKLQSVLSDPESMEKILSLAGGMLDHGAPAAPAALPGAAETASLQELARFVGQGGKERKALLAALRPYLKREKQERLDQILFFLSALEMLSNLPVKGESLCTGEN